MDIQLLAGVLSKTDKTSPGSLLQTAPLLEARVIDSLTGNSGDTLIKVQLQDQVLQLITPQTLKLSAGQKLPLQLLSKTPVLTLKLLAGKQTTPSPDRHLPAAKEVILKQWSADKTAYLSPPPSLSLKHLSKLTTIPVTFRFEITTVTDKTVEGKMLLQDKKTVSSFPEQASLKLDRSQIQIDDHLRLKTGNTLLFRFDPKKADIIQAPADKTDTKQSIQQALRTFLPRQQPSPVVLETLMKHIDQISQRRSVPEALKTIARQILSDLPKTNRLVQPKLLKQSVEQSGIFLESKLTLASDMESLSFRNDFKAKLLHLLDQIEQRQIADKTAQLADPDRDLIRQIQQKTSQALARIVVDQLQSLPREEGNKQVWLLEIPFLNQDKPDKVRLEIERQPERDKSEKEGSRWSVNITVTPPGLGTIYCKIVCLDQVVSTRFWSESATTAEKISRFLDVLKQQLEDKGLTTGMMTAEQGKPETQAPFPPSQLLNEKA